MFLPDVRRGRRARGGSSTRPLIFARRDSTRARRSRRRRPSRDGEPRSRRGSATPTTGRTKAAGAFSREISRSFSFTRFLNTESCETLSSAQPPSPARPCATAETSTARLDARDPVGPRARAAARGRPPRATRDDVRERRSLRGPSTTSEAWDLFAADARRFVLRATRPPATRALQELVERRQTRHPLPRRAGRPAGASPTIADLDHADASNDHLLSFFFLRNDVAREASEKRTTPRGTRPVEKKRASSLQFDTANGLLPADPTAPCFRSTRRK